MKTTTDFREFMSYVDWEELNTEEKQAFFESAHGELRDKGTPFPVVRSNNGDNVVLVDTFHNYGLILTPQSRAIFPKWLEDQYMYGEDGYSYLSWLEAIQKEELRESFVKETTINMLPTEECRVIKKIGIAYKARKRVHFASIIYERPLMVNAQKGDGNVDSNDELDDAIYGAVKDIYPEATLTTELQLFDSEKLRNETLLQNKKRLSADFGILLEEDFPLFHTTITKELYPHKLNVYCFPNEATLVFSNLVFLYRTQDYDKYNRLVNLIQSTLK